MNFPCASPVCQRPSGRTVAAARANVNRPSGAEPYVLGGGTLQLPLDWAALGKHVDAAELLLALRADADACDSFGVSALHWAAGLGSAIVKALLDSKATVDIGTTEKTNFGNWCLTSLTG